MTETERELACELARHPAWVWMDGMRVIPTWAADGVSPRRLCHEPWKHDGSLIAPPHGHVLDLSDPATLGCIMVAIGDVKIDALDPWVQWRNADGSFSSTYSDTLGEALARAWLAVHGGSDA